MKRVTPLIAICLVALVSGCSETESYQTVAKLNSNEALQVDGNIRTGVVSDVLQIVRGDHVQASIFFEDGTKLSVERSDGQTIKWEKGGTYTVRWNRNQDLLIFQPTKEFVEFQYNQLLEKSHIENPQVTTTYTTMQVPVGHSEPDDLFGYSQPVANPVADPLVHNPTNEQVIKAAESDAEIQVAEAIIATKEVEALKEKIDDRKKYIVFYAIYDHPTDYPDHFVVRKWGVSGSVDEPQMKALEVIGKTHTIEDARKLIPENHQNIGRFFGEDQKITESWISK